MFNGRSIFIQIMVLCFVLGSLATGESLGQTPDLEEAMSLLGFDSKDSAGLLSGEIVSGQIKEGADKELAVTVAMWVPGTVEEVIALVRERKILYASRAAP